LILADLDVHCLSVIKAVGLDKRLEIHLTVDAAVRALREEPAATTAR
jgi:hypothetical protein